MNLASLGKKLLPHFIIIGIFLVISSMFFSPVLNGKVLPQGDIRQFSGSYQEVKAFQEKTGERSLWTNSMFGGMPTYNIAPYSPNSMIGTGFVYAVLVTEMVLPKPINALFLYMFGFYFLLLAFRVNPWLSMIGAIAYGFSTFNIVILEAGHMLQAYGLGTAPLVLAAAVYTIRWRKYFLGGSLFALAFAMNLRTNHPQMTYYMILVLGIYLLVEFIYYAIIEKQFLNFFKSILAIGIGGIVAFGTTVTFQLTTLEYSKASTRGPSELTSKLKEGPKSSGLDIDYAFGWSYEIPETFTLMIPDFRGGASAAIGEKHHDAVKDVDPQVQETVAQMDEYWGDQDFTSGPFYFGAIICFLFLLGLLTLKTHYRWWILAVTVFSFMLSWGRHFMDFNELMFYHFPLYSKFRSVMFTLVMAAMVMPVLAMITLNKILEGIEWNKKTKQRFIIAFALTGGLCLAFWLIPDLAGDFLKPEDVDKRPFKGSNASPQAIDAVLSGLQEARKALLKADAIRSFLFILLAGGALWLYNMKLEIFKSKNGKYIIIGIIAILIMADQISVNRRYLNEKNFVSKRSEAISIDPTEADNFILQDPDPDYRVLNVAVNTFNDATTSYFHKSIGGYHGAKMKRFQELRDRYYDPPTTGAIVSILRENATKMPGDQLLNILQQTHKLGVLNMMDCKYIIAGQTAKDVIKNPYHLDHAWFVKGVKLVQNADQELASLDGFNPADTAVIDGGSNHPDFNKYMEGFTASPEPSATIKLDEYKPNYLKYTSDASKEQFAVFSEVYYDNNLGWNVYIDGKPAKHIRVNYLIRGMRVPSGHHVIEFKFMPQSFVKGERIELIASMLMLFGLIGSIGWEVWKGRKKQDEILPEKE
jgi:hypothetical protein